MISDLDEVKSNIKLYAFNEVEAMFMALSIRIVHDLLFGESGQVDEDTLDLLEQSQNYLSKEEVVNIVHKLRT